MLYIGVDLGTSAVKLLLMDGEGKIQKIVSREYPISFPTRAGLSRIRKTGGSRVWKESRSLQQSVIKTRWPESALAARCTVW